MLDHDKAIERDRYDSRAKAQLDQGARDVPGGALGSAQVAACLRAPYLHYEAQIRQFLRLGMRVLELGAGTGTQTAVLVATGADVVASDISPNALAILARSFGASARLASVVADMEDLPFDAKSFDLVVSAGSLSYGDPDRVDREIKRVLRPGGAFIGVDSLNHNPVYRINRWLQFMRGSRSRSTIERMPDISRIAALADGFADVQVHYFGALSFAMPVLTRVIGEGRAARLSDRFDALADTRRSAFKFVLTARGLEGHKMHEISMKY